MAAGQPSRRHDSSDLRLAAVGKDFGAVDEAGIVGCQEQRHLGDFLRLADTAERDPRAEIIKHSLLLGGIVTRKVQKERRADRTGADHVDADSGLLQIQHPASCQIADGRLRRRIDAECGRALDAGASIPSG